MDDFGIEEDDGDDVFVVDPPSPNGVSPLRMTSVDFSLSILRYVFWMRKKIRRTMKTLVG